MIKSLLLIFLLFTTPLYSQGTTYKEGQVLTVGASLPNPPCQTADLYLLNTGEVGLYICSNNTWIALSTGTSSIPSGLITLVSSGSCAVGWTEVSALNGKTLVGTVTANGDVGTTGGNDNITPAGTNSAATFTGAAWSAPAISWPAGVPTNANESAHTHSVTSNVSVNDHASHTHTYNQVITHTHAVTSVGSAATGATTNLTGASDTSSTNATAAAPAGAVATGTTAGPSATLTHTTNNPAVTSAAGTAHTHTASWPAGVPTIGAYTPAGTNSAATFTGTQFDNRSAFTKVIFCSKD